MVDDKVFDLSSLIMKKSQNYQVLKATLASKFHQFPLKISLNKAHIGEPMYSNLSMERPQPVFSN